MTTNGTYQRIRLWSPRTGGPDLGRQRLRLDARRRLDADGATVATASDRSLLLVDAPTGDVVG